MTLFNEDIFFFPVSAMFPRRDWVQVVVEWKTSRNTSGSKDLTGMDSGKEAWSLQSNLLYVEAISVAVALSVAYSSTTDVVERNIFYLFGHWSYM